MPKILATPLPVPRRDCENRRKSPYLISPEFEGIKTVKIALRLELIAYLISPEFEGIKTEGNCRACARWCPYLISPEFEGIKTLQCVRSAAPEPYLISPEFEGIKTSSGIS